MATSSFGLTAASATSIANNAPKLSTYLLICPRKSSKVSFRLSSKPKLRFLSKGLHSNWNRSILVRSLNSVGGSSDTADKSEVLTPEPENVKPLSEASPAPAPAPSPVPAPLTTKESIFKIVAQVARFINLWLPKIFLSILRFLGSLFKGLLSGLNRAIGVSTEDKPKVAPETNPSEESISEFITQVSSLIKLVDSRDIIELELKQEGREVLIRKKEALPPPPSPPTQPYPYQYVGPTPATSSPPPPPSPPPATSPAAAPASAPAPTPSKSSFPPLKSPMAGTFYRSPGPGEPAFVKVGDKVKKGQVLCIIEAMKLMNEIEADQAGTIIEVVAEDAKPVSVDTPLFVIEP